MENKNYEPLGSKMYFEQVADRYTERSASLLWRWQRHRESIAVFSLLGDVEGLNILDLGCGAGYYTRCCLDRGVGEVTAVDFSPRMIEQLPKDRVTGVVADATETQLERQFPKIICAGLLEFVVSPEKVLNSALHLVEKEGVMVCLIPPDNLAGRLYRKFHQRNGVNISLFSKSLFFQLAHGAGWRIDKFKYLFPYTSVYRLKVG